MPNRPIRSSSRAQPQPSAIPLQSFQLTKEQLSDPAVMNVMLQQMFTALNQANGSLGPVVLPAGLDVKGSPISNVGAPQSPGDAISSSHAQGSYSPEVVGPQLDIGGEHALKGLNAAYALSSQANSSVTSIQNQLAQIGTQNDVSTARTPGTIYQNGGSAIFVSGFCNAIAGGSLASIDYNNGPTSGLGLNPWGMEYTSTLAGSKLGFSFIVPPGYFYEITIAGDVHYVSGTSKWFEAVMS